MYISTIPNSRDQHEKKLATELFALQNTPLNKLYLTKAD